MRAITTLGKLGAIVSMLAACGSDPGAATESSPTQPADAPAGRGTVLPSNGGAPATTPTSVGVKGVVTDHWGAPLANAKVLVVAADGVVTETVVDAHGAFAFAKVRTPYDLKLTPPDPSVSSPRSLLGLTRTELKIIDDRSGKRDMLTAHVSLTLALPPCATTCQAQISTRSLAEGVGDASFTWSGAPTQRTVDVTHTWSAPAGTAPSATDLAVDVLLSNATGTSFSYAHYGTFSLEAGGKRDLGTITPEIFDMYGPIPFAISGLGIPDEWQTDARVDLRLPGDASMGVALTSASSFKALVPNVPAATMTLSVRRDAPITQVPTLGKTPVLESSEAIVDAALTAPNVVVALAKGPEMIAPLPDGELSRGHVGFLWTPTPNRLACVAFYDSANEVELATVMTGVADLTFERLAKLGITFHDGPFEMLLETSPGSATDALVDPVDATAVRSTREDFALQRSKHLCGSHDWTDLEFNFEVTP